ncbi:DUF397 domain-containing protein [Streptomyces sp. NPDC001796]|uniref:DUF397 domain-containing protein n=1 Tax=Streptomyces sp. NPDC001796 TaxID=3364609 RepID=UPI0036BDBF45
MRAIDLTNVTWHKSSYSNSDGGQCVEVAKDLPSVVPVRDSKDPARGTLLFEAAAWARFIDEVKRT